MDSREDIAAELWRLRKFEERVRHILGVDDGKGLEIMTLEILDLKIASMK